MIDSKFWQDIIEQERTPTTPPKDYISAKKFAEESGCSLSTAKRRLDDMVEDGTLAKMQCKIGAHFTTFYGPPR